MFLRSNILRALLPGGTSLTPIQVAGLKDMAPLPRPRDDIVYPERNRLKMMEKVPHYPAGMKPFKMQKRLRYMRGPEELHTSFIHKQFGIVAMCGGRLRHGHFEMIRLTLAKNMDANRMFGTWRVDAPWQPVTRKSQGHRMGGGKGAIDHYVTPVKANRVIMEVAGDGEFFEIRRWLKDIASKLPFKAMALTHEMLEEMKNEEKRLEETNINPWTFKYIVQNNLGGCHNWISPVDKVWFGKYR